jgi:hypothetical protein
MELYGKMEVQIHWFLTSALAGIGEFHSPNGLAPRENAPFPHWSWGWMGPSASLNALENSKFLAYAGNRATIPRLLSS